MLSSRKNQIRRKEFHSVRPDYKGCAGILERHRDYIGGRLRFGQVQVAMQPDAPSYNHIAEESPETGTEA